MDKRTLWDLTEKTLVINGMLESLVDDLRNACAETRNDEIIGLLEAAVDEVNAISLLELNGLLSDIYEIITK